VSRDVKCPGKLALPGALLLVVAIAGCGEQAKEPTATQSAAKHASTAVTPLVLHLSSGSYSTATSQTTLRGRATPGASIEVNGHFVASRHGRWRRTLRPHLGHNRVVVEATMRGHAPVIRSITITRHRTTAEIQARQEAKREAETRAAAKREAELRNATARREAETQPVCTNGVYTNSAGNTVCKPEHSSTVPEGATAKCEDGTYSFSESRSGTCSYHGGVAEWLSE